MNGAQRTRRLGVLLLITATILSLGWSVSRPMPYLPQIAAASTESPHLHRALGQAPENDFIDPQRFRIPSARLPAMPEPSPSAAKEKSSIVAGCAVRLDPAGSLTVPLSGRIEFVVTLKNIQTSDWRVIGELHVNKGDGTSEKLFGPRAIRLGRDQTLRLPVGFAANPKRFPPGPTQFIAVLKDHSGQIIDQATVTFTLELGQ